MLCILVFQYINAKEVKGILHQVVEHDLDFSQESDKILEEQLKNFVGQIFGNLANYSEKDIKEKEKEDEYSDDFEDDLSHYHCNHHAKKEDKSDEYDKF